MLHRTLSTVAAVLLSGLAFSLSAQNTASLRILLPERTRLLQGQRIDLVVEVRNASALTGFRVMAGDTDITASFSAPVKTELDCDASSDWTARANLQAFETPGNLNLTVMATADGAALRDSRQVQIRPFAMPADQPRKNYILFIGDAMGTAYRDAARLVARSVADAEGRSGLREGYFDNLLEMDKMPVSGMSMTYGSDSIVPDSANTGTAWSTGNKSFLNAVNVFADGNDCRWRFSGVINATTEGFILDNPRVETMWQYLKRRFGYRTGIVSTADITDATPAVQGSYSGFRQTRFAIASQYLANPMLGGQPAFDVILGGGRDQFLPQGRSDGRDLIAEFRAKGFRYVENATQLRTVRFGQPLLGLFKASAAPRPASDGIRTNTDANMDVAYDKLGLPRPASEPAPNLGTFTDQPMLDLMTEKAIEVLSSSFSQSPFVLMVEAASIDKQSHPNHASGTIWDTIEFDKAIGVARQWAGRRTSKDTLLVVTADHDQSMSIIGVNNVNDTDYLDRSRKEDFTVRSARGAQNFSVYGDSAANARAGLPFINASVGAENNSGIAGMPGTITFATNGTVPAASTYSTYFGFPHYPFDARSGYPLNTAPQGQMLRRLSVGFRTGDHTGSSVPVTAEGPGAILFTGYMDQTDIFFKAAAALSGQTAAFDKMMEELGANTSLPRTFGK